MAISANSGPFTPANRPYTEMFPMSNSAICNRKKRSKPPARAPTLRSAARRQWRCNGDPTRGRLWHTEDQHRCNDAQGACGEEGRQIGQELGAHDAGRERGAGGADLMTGEDPAEHHAGAFAAETISGQFYRRWHGRDPIKTIEHREQRQAIEREISERQIEQRQSTQTVIPEQEPAIVEAVRQPARAYRPDEIERTHHGEYARGRGGGKPIIVAERDEMRLDEAVCAATADKERAEQYPENRRPRAVAQRNQRRQQKRRKTGAACGRRRHGRFADRFQRLPSLPQTFRFLNGGYYRQRFCSSVCDY